LRKFALAASAFAVLFAIPAYSQQFDVAAGGSVLESSSPNPSFQNFQQPTEKGGTYTSASADFVGFRKRRLGLNLEAAWRYHQGNYPFNAEMYRPVFTDVNALFQPRLGEKFGLDLMAGLGIASTRFTLPSAPSCSAPSGGCINYTGSNHFMEHLSGGVRYYFWRKVFVRPELHYYHIQNNFEFHSDSVFRAGVSVGYTFGSK